MPNLPEHDTIALKIKLRHTCEKYSQIKALYKYRTVTDNLHLKQRSCHRKAR